jgi:hypothetical protein
VSVQFKHDNINYTPNAASVSLQLEGAADSPENVSSLATAVSTPSELELKRPIRLPNRVSIRESEYTIPDASPNTALVYKSAFVVDMQQRYLPTPSSIHLPDLCSVWVNSACDLMDGSNLLSKSLLSLSLAIVSSETGNASLRYESLCMYQDTLYGLQRNIDSHKVIGDAMMLTTMVCGVIEVRLSSLKTVNVEI